VLRRKQGSTAIRRRPGARRQSRNRLRRRCSINGHFYNRETSFFTPPHGSQMSVWVTSLVSTQEVINLMLDKYKVDAKPDNFALFIVRDNGGELLYYPRPTLPFPTNAPPNILHLTIYLCIFISVVCKQTCECNVSIAIDFW
jgi:hypothetical protein